MPSNKIMFTSYNELNAQTGLAVPSAHATTVAIVSECVERLMLHYSDCSLSQLSKRDSALHSGDISLRQQQ